MCAIVKGCETMFRVHGNMYGDNKNGTVLFHYCDVLGFIPTLVYYSYPLPCNPLA